MSKERTEPLSVLRFRLGEARRKRAMLFGWGVIFSVATIICTQLPLIGNSRAIHFTVTMAFYVAAWICFFTGIDKSTEIPSLREKIAWAEADAPCGGSASASKSDLLAWLTFAGSVVTAAASIIAAIASGGA
jgi:hypothetical protein